MTDRGTAHDGPRIARDSGTCTALAAVYFAAGTLGLKFAVVHPSASAVWPPAGIALAALLLLGYRVWPGILMGAFLVNGNIPASTAETLLERLSTRHDGNK